VVVSSEFLIGEVGVEIHLKIVGLEAGIVPLVVGSDELEVVEPDLESVFVFDGVILFIVLFLPDLEHEILMWLHVGLEVEEADSSHCD
jgi:hypothetical protein